LKRNRVNPQSPIRNPQFPAPVRNPLDASSIQTNYSFERMMPANTPKLLTAGIVDVQFGANVKIVQPVNVYGCVIGDDCFIGPFVEIQRKVTIGRRTRIQSHAFICELVEIGEDCFISHGAMFVNDLARAGQPAFSRPDLWKRTRLGNRVFVGTNATVLPVDICDDVVVGAGAVVTKDIGRPGIYAGNPARYLRAIEKADIPK
jgi:acetyltransferase-like isoleucine patch superfamily enzyme